MTRSEFNKAIALLVASVGKQLPDEQVQAWYVMLQDLTAEELQRGIVTTIRTHEYAGFPPIGTIRKNAVGRDQAALSVEDRAIVAWGAIKRSVAIHGAYATVQFDDPIVTATVMELGGWVRFCDCEAGEPFDVWLRKEFERTYTALMAAGVTAERTQPLAGICDATNSATGHSDREAVRQVDTGLSPVPARLVRGDMPQRVAHEAVRRIAHESVKSLGLHVEDEKEKPVQRSREEQIEELRKRMKGDL